MTRFAIDADVAIRLAREQVRVPDPHRLVGPHLLRSQAMSTLYREVRRGALTPAEATELLERITTTPMRLLGDRVSRATAWRIATRLGWEDTATAEYVAVATLQADLFVTLDDALAAQVAEIVPTAGYEALLGLVETTAT